MGENKAKKKISQYLLQRNDIKFEYYVFPAHVFLNMPSLSSIASAWSLPESVDMTRVSLGLFHDNLGIKVIDSFPKQLTVCNAERQAVKNHLFLYV